MLGANANARHETVISPSPSTTVGRTPTRAASRPAGTEAASVPAAYEPASTPAPVFDRSNSSAYAGRSGVMAA
jgi:hypothetical protein